MKEKQTLRVRPFSPWFLVLIAAVLQVTGTDVRAQASTEEIDEEAIEEIVVSAKFQRSLASAIQQKRIAFQKDGAHGLKIVP